MKKLAAFFILCLFFSSIHGQEVFGYYKISSSNALNPQWTRLSPNDTALSVIPQKRRTLTVYVISYHDIKVKFKIDNDILPLLDSIGVHLEKLTSPHYVTFWCFPSNNDSKWGIGYRVPGTIRKSKSIQINIFPKSECAMDCPLVASHIALKTRKKHKRVYIYVETRGKGKYIKVSREKAIRMVKDENSPQQP